MDLGVFNYAEQYENVKSKKFFFRVLRFFDGLMGALLIYLMSPLRKDESGRRIFFCIILTLTPTLTLKIHRGSSAVAAAFFFENIEKVHEVDRILVFTSETL